MKLALRARSKITCDWDKKISSNGDMLQVSVIKSQGLVVFPSRYIWIWVRDGSSKLLS